jgi:hypothetical protein
MFFRFTDKTVEELQAEAEDDEMLQVRTGVRGQGGVWGCVQRRSLRQLLVTQHETRGQRAEQGSPCILVRWFPAFL